MSVLENIKDKTVGISVGALLTVIFGVAMISGDFREMKSRVHANEMLVKANDLEVKAAILRLERKVDDVRDGVSDIRGFLRGKEIANDGD